MGRRTFLVVALGLVLFARFAQPVDAANLDADKIKAALRTATPEEDGFIEKVLAKVEDGTLPVAMVESTFLWARQKPKNKFQYFKQALTLRASKIGIDLQAVLAQQEPTPAPPSGGGFFAHWPDLFRFSFLSRLNLSRR